MNPKKLHSTRGFTMAELLIVIVCIGLLATIAVPTVNRVRDALTDHAKVRNADRRNEYMSALYNGGVDTSTYGSGSAAISALASGVTIPATIENGATMEVRLEKNVNAAAYEFQAGTTNTAPRFTAKLGERNVRP